MAKAKPQYSIAFNEHSVHEGLKQLKAQVADLPDELLEAAQAQDQPASLARLEPALDYVGALLASADTALVTPQMLEGLAAPIQQISSALTPLKDNEDFEQLPTLQANVDALLNAAMQIAGAIGVWAKTDQKKAAAQLGEAATEKTHQLQQQASNLQGQLNQLQEQAKEAAESVKAAAVERANELQTQLNTLKEEADAESAKVQGAIDEFGAQFNSEQDTRSTQFEEKQKELADKAEQVIQEGKDAAAEALKSDQESAKQAVSDLTERSNETMAFLSEKKQEAIDMVDVAATSSTAGGFKKEAEEQRSQADLWRYIAIIGGAIAAVVALVAVAFAVEGIGGGDASLIIAKIAAITLLLGIAGYAAGQSGQHRRREQRARRLYLELVAFKPFSEPLSDDDKTTVRKDFIERLFVGDPGAEGEDHKGDDVKLSDENLSILLKFIDVVRSGSTS
ncbi:MAG TPA: hypothetical protein VIS95_10370 [Solirubrobacterales bacterium]